MKLLQKKMRSSQNGWIPGLRTGYRCAPARQQAIQAAIWQSVAQRTVNTTTTARPKPGLLRQLVQRRVWLPYAAAVAVLVTGSVAVYNTRMKKAVPGYRLISALPRQAKTVLLPDSSTVHLFPGATVAVPDNFNGDERTVRSTGRVFFEVKHDTTRPFLCAVGPVAVRAYSALHSRCWRLTLFINLLPFARAG